MATLQQLTPHPKWKHLIGKEVVFSIKGVKQLSDTLYFIGENMVGQKVISTETQRAMFYIDSWDDVEIRESCYSQLLKTYEL